MGLYGLDSLEKMNVPSRLIVYPDAGHWPGWYEMALYYTAHLEWFQKYLGGGGPPWTTEAFLRNAVFNSETGERFASDSEKAEQQRKQSDKDEAPKSKGGKPAQKPKG